MASIKYVSKGQRPNVRKDIRKDMRRNYVGTWDHFLNQVKAWQQGKRVMLTIPNPTGESNKPFIRIPATEVWGTYGKMKVF